MLLHNNPGFNITERASRKDGQKGIVSEAVAEALWTFRKECVFLQQMFLVLHMVEI